MANKINPLEIELTTLDKTSVDPICKILRNLARKEGYDLSKINVVFLKKSQSNKIKLLTKAEQQEKKEYHLLVLFLFHLMRVLSVLILSWIR